MEIASAKAPFVMFETRAIEDRAASLEAGKYMSRDVDYVLITPAGSKDQVERVVVEWFAQKDQDVREGRFNGDWLRYYKQLYADWKEGKETPLSGTALKNWPVVSPAQLQNLLSLKVLTVEALADCNEEVLRRLGMGGRALKQQAVDWLADVKNHGGVSMEITSLRVKVEALEGQNKELTAKNAALQAAVDALQTRTVSDAQPAGDDFMQDLETKPATSGFKPA